MKNKLRKIHIGTTIWKYIVSYTSIRIFSPTKEVTEVKHIDLPSDIAFDNQIDVIYSVKPSRVKKYIEQNLVINNKQG